MKMTARVIFCFVLFFLFTDLMGMVGLLGHTVANSRTLNSDTHEEEKQHITHEGSIALEDFWFCSVVIYDAPVSLSGAELTY